MNDEARDALAMAAFNGHPQAIGTLHDEETGGDCAIGVIHIAAHGGDRGAAIRCRKAMWAYSCSGRWGGMDHGEMNEIWKANDNGWDFLTISRKCCLGHGEGQAPQG